MSQGEWQGGDASLPASLLLIQLPGEDTGRRSSGSIVTLLLCDQSNEEVISAKLPFFAIEVLRPLGWMNWNNSPVYCLLLRSYSPLGSVIVYLRPDQFIVQQKSSGSADE